ncbi:MAG TPA: DinB family protein [Trebonia sp.]|nr:DinB family protein [Trebonia sp.]
MIGDAIGSEPPDPPFTGPERAILAGWLEFHRATLLLKCEGLDDEQRKRRPVRTSLMSLHGMVRHMANVERNWFRRALDQPDAPAIWADKGKDTDWAPLDSANWAADLAVWQAECEHSRLTAGAHDLNDTGVAMRGGERAEFSLRWIYSHMIEEYARHNGHADLVRELVNGATDMGHLELFAALLAGYIGVWQPQCRLVSAVRSTDQARRGRVRTPGHAALPTARRRR